MNRRMKPGVKRKRKNQNEVTKKKENVKHLLESGETHALNDKISKFT